MSKEKEQMTDEKKSLSGGGGGGGGGGLGVRHLQVLMMCVSATTIYVLRSSMGAAILAMTDASQRGHGNVEIYDWSEGIRGVILSSFFWGYTVAQIPAGVLSKVFGGKIVLFLALFTNGLMALATPFLISIGGWVALVAVRVCMGLTQSCFIPATHTLLGQWAPVAERTRLSNFSYAGIQFGTIITMPLCAVLSTTSLGWTLIFYSMGALALAAAALFWFLTASTPRQHPFIGEAELRYIETSLQTKAEEEQVPIPWRHIVRSRAMWAIAAAHIGGNWCFTIFLVQIPTYLKNALGINITDSAMLSSLPFVSQWLFSWAFSFLSDFLISRDLLSLTNCRKLFNTIAAVGTAAGLTAMSFLSAEHRAAAVATLVLTVGLSSGICSGYMLNHIDLSPRFGGVMYGMSNCLANLLGLLAPLSAGFILEDQPTELGRWRVVFFTAAALALACDLLYVLFTTSRQQPWNDPQQGDYDLGSKEKGQEKNITPAETLYKFPENTEKET